MLACPVCALQLPAGAAFDRHLEAELATGLGGGEDDAGACLPPDVAAGLPGGGKHAPAASGSGRRVLELGGGPRPSAPLRRPPRGIALPSLAARFNHFADGGGQWVRESG